MPCLVSVVQTIFPFSLSLSSDSFCLIFRDMPAWAGRTYFPLGVARNASDDNSRVPARQAEERRIENIIVHTIIHLQDITW